MTRLVDMTKHSVELTNDKRQRAEQAREGAAAVRPNLGPKPVVLVPRPSPEAAGARPPFRPAVAGGTGRGLMHKFIASRGRLRPVSVFSAAPSGPAAVREPSPVAPQLPAAAEHTVSAAPGGPVCRGTHGERSTRRAGPVTSPDH